ncbi:MAG: hypothetical protein HUJ26_22555 [Planctomycetaceae bacterium]|nr:hypothetical protein [Planctomycetaceae bacterium]
MVDHDLTALSAPIEELRADVQAAYERLDNEWEAVANTLKKLPIPCDVACCIGEHPTGFPLYELSWRKWKGKKRVCYVVTFLRDGYEGPEEEEDVTPYDEWSGPQKLKYLSFVPKLFDAAREQTQQFISLTQSHGAKK